MANKIIKQDGYDQADIVEVIHELATSAKADTAARSISLAPHTWLDEGGGTTAALAIFANASDPTPGFTNLSSEGLGVRWNNHATPDPIITAFAVPTDLDATKDITVKIRAVRSATDATDLTTFTVTAFQNAVGAAAGADANFGGVSSAMVNNTNIQELTLTLAAANIVEGGDITLTLQPTDGLLATVDVTVLGVTLVYTAKANATTPTPDVQNGKLIVTAN